MKKHTCILTLGIAVLMGTGMALAERPVEPVDPPEVSVPQAAPVAGSEVATVLQPALEIEAEPDDGSTATEPWPTPGMSFPVTPAENPASPGTCEDPIPLCSDPCCPRLACLCNLLTGECDWTCLCVC